MSKDLQSSPVSDPRVLRAIAHPVRNRILQELFVAGHSRAADLADELGIPANQASFHLRQLAKYGLVEPAPEHARDGRDRVWKPVNEHGLAISFNELEKAPGGSAAVTVFRRQAAARAQEAVARAYAYDEQVDAFVSIGENALRLTKGEAEEFAKALAALQEKWEERTQAHDDEARRTYQLMTFLQPMPDLREASVHDPDGQPR